jgi:ABC-type phosphate transport system substrate-binding protein
MRTQIAAVAAVLALSMAGPAGAADTYKVIVNSRVAGKSIARATLSQIFLGRVERWGDGHEIEAVDLSTTSPTRAAFSQDILGMSVLGVRQYWTRTIASGHMPPLTRPSDEEVIAFVAARGGAVGYVSGEAVLPDTVRVVAVQ